MNAIQLKGDVSLEQYQMAVRVLEAIGLDVEKYEGLPKVIIEGIEEGWQELRNGKGIPSDEVRKKAWALCEEE